MVKTLGELLTEAALPVLSEGADAVRAALGECLTRVLGPMDLQDLAALVRFCEVVFLGVPEGFDPKVLLRGLVPAVFARLTTEVDLRGDGSDGPFVWLQCERAQQKGLHVDGKDWSFVRQGARRGETCFYSKDMLRSGRPLIVVECSFGNPVEFSGETDGEA